MRAALVLPALTILSVIAASCGGEPVTGDIKATFKGASFKPEFGVAIEGQAGTNPGGMFIFVGNGDIDCTNAETSPPDGTYVIGNLKAKAVGSFQDPDGGISVAKIDTTHFESVSSGNGVVNIDSLDGDSVKGSMTMDDGSGTTVAGSFVVKKCF